MQRVQIRIWIGAGLIVLGVLLLLEKLKLVFHAAEFFLGALFLIFAAYFFISYVRDAHRNWWAVIPAMALLGMALNTLISSFVAGFGGGIFLGALALSFFIIYFGDHTRWWAILPGGALLTLAAIATFEPFAKDLAPGILFFGLGLTFLLLALLPNPSGKMDWAYIPALVLILFGAFFGTPAAMGYAGYFWPAALILLGLVLLLRFFVHKE